MKKGNGREEKKIRRKRERERAIWKKEKVQGKGVSVTRRKGGR